MYCYSYDFLVTEKGPSLCSTILTHFLRTFSEFSLWSRVLEIWGENMKADSSKRNIFFCR